MENLNRHEKALIHAVAVLKEPQYKKFIKAIYMYGSCARKDYKDTSDVDLFIRVDPCMPQKLRRQLRVEVIPDDFRLPDVDLKISDSDDFSDSNHFNDNVRKDAVLLWKEKEVI
ncbi:nucleotidyltransferase domain-containing protein [Acetivibrio ethanolgignens]|uniref:Polymerase beta nucleotidyltransferase domain-containing protein n=1 Tax=Acetivibrio ethanolgignens TaxID=290052 RepID=A0A0V8QE49_9FIRM|nr:nucleotidyltransferase domain-containing protein [Acetivibrio ethanolgignens]KSV58748.1 hypothetical protein ASU35_11840 [Acetivibrio ethanolgignens]